MKNVRPLSETDSYVLFSEDEDVFLFDKDLNYEIWRTSIDGKVTCGLIGLCNEWLVVGGKHLVTLVDDQLKTVFNSELMWIHDIRQIEDYEIDILINPWSQIAAIWRFNLKTFSITKVRNFKDYYNKPFEEMVKW